MSTSVAQQLPRTPRPGVHPVGDGVDIAVYASHATQVWFCHFSPDGTETRVELPARRHGWWSGHVPEIGLGTHYGFRVDGAWSPQRGHRHNPAKLLVDPYAKAIVGDVTYDPAVYAHVVSESGEANPAERCDADSAPFVPRSVVIDTSFDWGDDRPPERLLGDSIIYETHVRELTMQLPQVPEHLRGTYAGVAHPATIAHLHRLGVTTVELLPVHSFTDEPHLHEIGLTNHWGYNTLGFFAPHLPYSSNPDPTEALREFKGMVKLLHAAGIAVLLDVVYNHTAEQSVTGAMLSWRGLDSRAYYRLDQHGNDVDVTGCGGTLDVTHPTTVRMVLDSLRYWVTECHIDGFRFDLMTALARDAHNVFDPDHQLLTALRTDPVLSEVVLIAEPWDVGPGGWRTGQFPEPISEWNDRFRNAVRSFWLVDLERVRNGEPAPGGVADLATRMAGSEDFFGDPERGPEASINFVTAHDGFTMADLTAYDHKHNEANGEDNRDGTTDNRSWNHGVEGPTDDPAILGLRRRSMRNLMATQLLATGVPMITGGDELGRTGHGNNNRYCQDNEIAWIDWDLQDWQQDLIDTTAFLIGLRQRYPTLRQRRFFTGNPMADDGSTDIAWYDETGAVMGEQWGDGDRRTLQMYLSGSHLGHESLLVVLGGAGEDGLVTLPAPPGVRGYHLLWDSAWERPADEGGQPPVVGIDEREVEVSAASIRVYRADDAT